MLVVLLWLLYCFWGRTTGYCLVGDEQDCAFECHCSVESECDTLDCPSGCQTGPLGNEWRGPFCQIGNVAFHKEAYMTAASTYQKLYPATAALDGMLPEKGVFNDHCALPTAFGNSKHPEWWINLRGLHMIYNVTIYGRTDCCQKRMVEFELVVYNSTDTEELCGSHDYPPVYTSKIIECTQPMVAEFLLFRRKGGYQPEHSALCEVVIIGYRIIDCSQCPAGVKCNDVTGCEACKGSYQPDCQKGCEAGHYGINCNATCDHCKPGSTCDRFTGVCTSGCEIWWAGELCTEYIPMPEWKEPFAEIVGTTSSSIEILFKQVSNVSERYREYYGYEFEYAVTGSAYKAMGPDIPLNADEEYIWSTIEELNSDTSYTIRLAVYRNMNEIREHSFVELILTARTERKDYSHIYLYAFGLSCMIIFALIGFMVNEYLWYKKKAERLLLQASTGINFGKLLSGT